MESEDAKKAPKIFAADGTSLERQKWIEAGRVVLAKLISAEGKPVPESVRISIGFPRGSRGGHAIGQCWGNQASADANNEIFISPELGLSAPGVNEAREQSITVLAVLAHELVHATVGVEAGHKGPFKQLATAIMLEGKMTATVPSVSFKEWANPFLTKHGFFPMGKLSKDGRKKQGTRLLKCECDDCGYVARVTAMWIKQAGTPVCPIDEKPMLCDEV